MNHADVEERGAVDIYLRGGLSADEAVQFEQHFLSCPACLDQLEAAEGLQRGLRRAAVQDVSQVTERMVQQAAVQAAVRQLAVVSWLSRLGRSRQAALLATGLLLVLLLPGLALRRAGELGRELRRAEADLAVERGAERSGDAAAARLRAALDASRRDLARERQVRTAAEQAAAAARAADRRPQVNLPVLVLEPARGGPGGGPGAEPAQRLRLPARPGWAVLTLTVEPPHPRSYLVTLRGPGGQEVWRGAGLRPDALDVLTLGLPTELLVPGDHLLVVEGAAGAEPPRPAARFPFRVLPPA